MFRRIESLSAASCYELSLTYFPAKVNYKSKNTQIIHTFCPKSVWEIQSQYSRRVLKRQQAEAYDEWEDDEAE